MWIERVEETTEANRAAAESAGNGRGWARAKLVRSARRPNGLAALAELLAGPSAASVAAPSAPAARLEQAALRGSLLERAAELIGEALSADEVEIQRAAVIGDPGQSPAGESSALVASWARAGRPPASGLRGPRSAARLIVPCRASGELFAVLRIERARLGAYADRDGEEQARVAAALIAAHLERERQASEIAALRAEQARSERLCLLGRVASSAAHDFNNVLTAILGYSDLLELELEAVGPPAGASRAPSTASASRMLPDRGRAELEEIRLASERGASLVEELLSLGRGGAKSESQAEPLDLAALLTRLEGMARRLAGDGIRLAIEVEPDLPRICVAREGLERVVLNLVANARHAIEACPDRAGRITLSLAREREGGLGRCARGEAAGSGDSLRLSVRDDGCGMDEAVKRRLFEPFFTTRPDSGGTGLGLASVADFVRRAGGRIEVESAPGQGTALHLHFPIQSA